jgi:quinol monooxygenase YgiN
MSLIVVAAVYPEPEHRSEVIAAFVDAISQVHTHDRGCELYALHESDDRLVMIEKWASAEALEVHSKGDALRELTQRLDGKIIGRLDVQVLRPHPAGTPQQGSL